MPVYVYRCPVCGNEKQLQRSIEKRDEPVVCGYGVKQHRTPAEVLMQRLPTSASFSVLGFNAKNGYSQS